MAPPIAMDVRLVSTPHLDLNHIPLADKNFQIKDTSLLESPLKFYCQYRDQYLKHADKIGLWESNFPKYQFVEVHIFPEIFHYCHASYILSHRVVMSPNQTILFTITTKPINEMIQLQLGKNLTPISIGDLFHRFPNLTTAKLAEIIQTFIKEEKYILKDPPPYLSTMFSPFHQDIVAMITSVLNYTTSGYIDEIILAFMSIFTLRQPPAIIYDYAKLIADRMRDRYLRMSNERTFKYSPILYHLFLYYEEDKFHFTLQKLDPEGHRRSMILQTPLFHKHDSPYSYTDFIYLFVYPIVTMLLGSPPPRIISDIRRILQLPRQHKVGDWYLYQNHIEIRIYGCDLGPHKLSKCLSMRLFSLQYYKHIINSYEVHFVKAKNKARLKIKDQLGPFVCNN